MADNKQTVDHTAIGDFIEVQPGVHVSARVNSENLIIPAEASQTGVRQQLPMEANTVIFSSADSKAFHEIATAAIAANNMTDMQQSMSLVSAWTKAAADPGKGSPKVVTAFARKADAGDGFRAFKVSDEGAMARVDSDPTATLVGSVGVDSISQLKVIPASYIQAFNTFATDHELHHVRGKMLAQDLSEEIRADFGSLTEHFNKPFTDFAMDMRALASLNVMFLDDKLIPIVETDEKGGAVKDKNGNVKPLLDDHATHIWKEEYGTAMPSDQQAHQIGEAGRLIQERAIEWVSGSSNLSREEVWGNLNHISDRLAIYKSLRANGAFDDIPFANEFVDKYTQAAERRYAPAVLAETKDRQAAYDDIAQHAKIDQGPALSTAPGLPVAAPPAARSAAPAPAAMSM